MASITAPSYAKSITVSDGNKYGYIRIEAKPGKPTLLFLHGYPSSSYHWHHQVQQCIDAGYGMVAPDLLGYGDTDKPAEFEKYDNTVISKHVMEILDHEKLPVVVGVGHDWGSIMLSTTARLYTKRFSQLIFLAVGYGASQERLQDIDAINAAVEPIVGWPIFGYWKFHNRPDAASVLEAADPMSAASLFYPEDPKIWVDNVCREGGMEAWITQKKTGKIAPWVSASELETHGKILLGGGYTGPLNWYKQGMAGVTHATEAKINPDYASTRFTIPTLLIATEDDMICRPVVQEHGMKDFFDDLTVKSLKTGHWVMLEKPKEMWEIIQSFVEEKGKKTSKLA